MSRRSPIFIRVTGARALAIACLTGLAAHASMAMECAQRHEQAALNASVVRTELMVAALLCGTRDDYDAFITRYQGALTEHGHLLRAYFRRHYGAAAERQLNQFVTRLANQESQRSVAIGRARFCASTAALSEQLLAEHPLRLPQMVDDPALASRHGIASCEGTGGLPSGG